MSLDFSSIIKQILPQILGQHGGAPAQGGVPPQAGLPPPMQPPPQSVLTPPMQPTPQGGIQQMPGVSPTAPGAVSAQPAGMGGMLQGLMEKLKGIGGNQAPGGGGGGLTPQAISSALGTNQQPDERMVEHFALQGPPPPVSIGQNLAMPQYQKMLPSMTPPMSSPKQQPRGLMF